ncbi:hypothetical protein [Cellulomonas rhizosphaerae]|uniref:ABC-type Mn/Zn transport systems, ATPase component n=1 Tax=Cellulomonas rhizosphaerae TaxID=2293719 RepID=A0A413RIJ4_9CELL|nr:hypothetical protein [Cellulomonas rhizosphaerae]RHA38151.1 hypothetical protein D1825_14705 [Cellulomonas rhizosphaerae]
MAATSNLLVRSLHDLGAAAWFGGTLMGAVGLNGASAAVTDPTDRIRTASVGWAKWAPVNAVAIGAHAVGGLGLILANRGRIKGQQGAAANTVVKTVLTVAAAGTTLYSGILGAKIAAHESAPADSGVTPSTGTPPEVASAQQQQRILQWVTPALVGTLVVLGAQQGEQQRPANLVAGVRAKLARS